VERVHSPLKEVNGDADTERVMDGDLVKLGDEDMVREVEEVGQCVVERVGEREIEGLRDIDGEAVNVLDTVGDTLNEGEEEALELALEDREFERVFVTEGVKVGQVERVEESDDEGD